MIARIKKLMSAGGLNSDDTPYLFPDGDYIKVVNGRYYHSRTGHRGAFHNIPSNLLVASSDAILSQITGNFTEIGSVSDDATGNIYYLLYNDAGNHLICEYVQATGICKVLIAYNQFYVNGTNGYNGLLFPANERVTGIAKIGDILAWALAGNEVRRINVTRNYSAFAIANFATPKITDEVITLIRRPPAYPVAFTKENAAAAGITNNADFISGNAFQFMYRYVYLDNEQSVLSPYSGIANYGYSGAVPVLDMINVQIPYAESIPVDILQVDLCMRYANGNNYFIIKSWNVNNAADVTALNQHNAGVANLQFNFFNNGTGTPLDQAYSVKPFDSVPITATALEAAKNRFFISNYSEGYNAPSQSSLSLSLVADTTTKTNLAGTWWQVRWKHNLNLHSDCILYAPTTTNPGYYYYAAYAYPDSAPGTFPATINLSDGQFCGNDFHSVVSFFVLGNFSGVSLRDFTSLGNTTSFNDVYTLSSNKPELKSNSAFQAGIIFYDRYLRNCGTFTADGLKISTPLWGSGNTNLFKGIQWTLSNANAVAEIPAFASYYAIARTKNLRYLAFVQAMAHTVAYYSGDGVTTPYQFYYGQYEPAPKYTGVAVDVSQLNTSGMGYTFQPGDILNLFLPLIPNIFSPPPSLYVSMAVKGQYGKWVLCALANLGSIGPGFGVGQGYTSAPQVIISGDGTGASATCSVSGGKVVSVTMTATGQGYTFATVSFSGGGGTGAIASAIISGSEVSEIDIPLYVDNAFFEIQTPYYPSLKEPYYEVGNMFPVVDAGTPTRQYSTLTGMLGGDIVILARTNSDNQTTYLTEAMSPNDKFFVNWNTDIGRPNLVIQQPGQLQNPYGIRFSNEYIQNTLVNGLSSFDLLNQVDVPAESGAVMKLQLTSKMQQLGTVMLAICQREALSLYLGETQVLQTQGTAFISGVANVIGTINPLRGGYGTLHPESVVAWEGRVYWYCMGRSALVRYSLDGVVAISNNKLKVFLELRTEALKSLMGAGTYFTVPGGYDPYNGECVVSFPQVSATPPAIYPVVVVNTITLQPPQPNQQVALKAFTFYNIVITVTGAGTLTISYGTQTLFTGSVTEGTVTVNDFYSGTANDKITVSGTATVSGIVFSELLSSPFQIDDNQAKTIGFDEDSNRFTTEYLYFPEGYGQSLNQMACFKKGRLYLHEAGAGYNNFFGIQTVTRFCMLVKSPEVKYIEDIAVEAVNQPDYCGIRVTWNYNDGTGVEQYSDLYAADFNWKEGIWYAPFYRDGLTPGQAFGQALQTGDRLRGQQAWIYFEFDNTGELVVNSVDTGVSVSTGHFVTGGMTT